MPTRTNNQSASLAAVSTGPALLFDTNARSLAGIIEENDRPMNTAAPMTRQVTIVNELGLHARSAAKIATAAQQAVSGVWIERDGKTADAASIIDMLTLACARGTTLTIGIENPADADLLNHIVELVESGFGE